MNRLFFAHAAVLLAMPACSGGASSDGASASASGTTSALAPKGPVLEAAENETVPAAASSAEAAPDPIVAIPAGKHPFGSTPGDRGRDPVLEPTIAEVDVGSFDIDRFFYPNEPGKPPMVGVSRQKAEGLCAARGRRLCTEVEWERACKGPRGTAFAGGARWDRSCASSPDKCASGFGVLGMGSRREWTAGDVSPAGDVKGGAAARGAPADADEVDHRCARRSSVDPGSTGDDLAFRCCGGSPTVVEIPKPREGEAFERVELPASELEEMCASVKELAKLTGEVKYFDEEAAAREVTARGDAGSPDGYRLTTAPLLWRPTLGEELVVVVAQVGQDSLIVSLYRLGDERYRVASSLVLKNDPGPVVLAFDRSVSTRLEWSTCWGCRGEGGRISYRDDRRVVITQE